MLLVRQHMYNKRLVVQVLLIEDDAPSVLSALNGVSVKTKRDCASKMSCCDSLLAPAEPIGIGESTLKSFSCSIIRRSHKIWHAPCSQSPPSV